MKYVEFVNSVLKKTIAVEENLVLFGQNINAASCLSGLTRGLGGINKGLTINTPNSENTLVGVGFGLMLNGISSIFFMKQMDFLLLGIDHLVNTYNVVRQKEPSASFTIFPINVDSGYEGPQSALNNFNDFCSIANIEGYSFTNMVDTEEVIRKNLVKPGFRIMASSQRLLKQDVINLPIIQKNEECQYYQYHVGHDVSVICFNFSLPYGIKLNEAFIKRGHSCSLFSVNSYHEMDYTNLIEDIRRSKNLVIIDDTKSLNKSSDRFLKEVYRSCKLDSSLVIQRNFTNENLYPNQDLLEIDYESIVEQFSACD